MATAVVAVIFFLYGLYYIVFDEVKKMYGITSIVNSMLMLIQCYLMFKFNDISKEIDK